MFGIFRRKKKGEEERRKKDTKNKDEKKKFTMNSRVESGMLCFDMRRALNTSKCTFEHVYLAAGTREKRREESSSEIVCNSCQACFFVLFLLFSHHEL